MNVKNKDVAAKKKRRKYRSGFVKNFLEQSIFAKFFFACAVIMVLSFLVLGTALVVFSVRYNNSEKERLYLSNAKTVAKNVIAMETIEDKQAASAYLGTALQMTASNLDATIYICDKSGKIELIVYPSGLITTSDGTMSKPAMSIINSRSTIQEESTLYGFFDKNYTVAGAPAISRDGSTVKYAVFVCAQSGSTMRIVSGIFKIFVYCVLMILMFAFIAIYFVTSRLTRPLRQMSSAAQSFSKGDFSARIPVESHDEIGELAAAFNNMASSLASLEEMRSSFVANVSHELKTPMTSISGFIDGILDGTIPPEKQNHYLKIVSDEVKRLSRLVKSLLDAARIEAGEYKINPTDFDVMELARRIIIGFEQSIDKKKLDVRGLDNDNKFMVTADFDLTYQIIYNLVDNAVKFANEGGYIEINVAAKSKKVYVGVKNSGMGIPSQDLPYVFDRFYKTDKSRSRDRKGVGLGLYIVKTILNSQGQDIVVRSNEGEFCEFVFTLKQAD